MDAENTGALPIVTTDLSPLPPIDEGHLAGLAPNSAALLVRQGPQENQRFVLSGSEIILGRADDSHILLDDVTVSRNHAKIIRDDSSGWTIVDLKSLNGTYLNQNRVDQATLAAGDELQIGKYRFSFLLPPQA
jgi:pSer/pThr/pTyr-binding forkhead associated (FHA) protein